MFIRCSSAIPGALDVRAWRIPLILAILLCNTVPSEARVDDPAALVFFEKEIRPLLVEKCQSCHNPKKSRGGLRLTDRESILQGGDSGPAIVSGNPDQSLLMRAIHYQDEPKMPPTKKLADAEIAKLQRWISLGAPWSEATTVPASRAGSSFTITEPQRRWWAFQPVRDQVSPEVQNRAWPQSPIDRFTLAKLEARQLRPAPAAERRVWLRRATFDLIGLPPTPEELAAFLADTSTEAYARVIDRLLDSPAYGQRWARHWLDVVRYADYHDGNPAARTRSCEPLEAWRYRDWVVGAFNRDLPFDQFIVHQIAGDLLPSPDGLDFYADGLVATTFLTNGSWDRGDADKEKMVSDMVDDQVDTIGKAFLGLTLGCARCHNHKFDPISQDDYYALAGMFYSTHILHDLGAKGAEYTLNRVPLAPKAYVANRERHVKQLAAVKAKLGELDKKAPKLPANDSTRLALVHERGELERTMPPEPPLAEAAQESGTSGGLFPGIQDVPLHIRGSYTRLGPVVPRRLPELFAGRHQKPIAKESGRRELASWIASEKNPLTARVIVNRVWQGHFGAGLVRTPNNFGMLSEPPTHSELLDWLAARFMEDGWSLKKLHRRIMLSATYGQSGAADADRLARDPDNRLLSRFMPRRLEAEAIRDTVLSAAGRLEPALGGPAVPDLDTPRRSLYIQTARWDRSTFATLFDAANPDASEEKRNVSTVATQALFLLNNAFANSQAERLANRLLREVPDDVTARIQRAYQLLFARQAREDELEIARHLLGHSPASTAAWRNLAHVLLCCNELIYID